MVKLGILKYYAFLVVWNTSYWVTQIYLHMSHNILRKNTNRLQTSYRYNVEKNDKIYSAYIVSEFL